MKTAFAAISALVLATGVAEASSQGPIGAADREATAVTTVEVPAGSVMTTRELADADLDADTPVTVTKIEAPEGKVDNSSRGYF
ncbi:hypothetical protein Q4511_07710 [Paracoccus sp. 1_MG-2023]|uniref:hypothetical protein n=1 Tax=unclassified Paracoccus (in: a-proteobacteria) TaxID=2688777 RepID=UPI001C08FDFC|nr:MULTISPECIES: hypothetical protein [unclassified Paracoccus (in: a-proteobacteria)]MBU2958000.1 hypothetical protein [Paracoccus sp. C2R09]MDO6668806.1 hypothetical protein [Paracoccus sp. 1_MG-2023]